MIAALLTGGLLACAQFLPASDTGDVTHVPSGLTVDGAVLAVDVGDIDDDGVQDLTVAVFDRGLGRRELRVFRLGPDGREPEPHMTVAVKSDVVAWCWAEVRPEPGRELVFVTRSGAWAYAPGGDGYRDILRLVQAEMLYDVADPRDLPLWEYVLPRPDGDRVILPGPDAFQVWGPGGEGGAYVAQATLSARASRVERYDDERREGIEVRPSGITLRGGGGSRLSDEWGPELPEAALVSADLSLRSPALADANGDGRLDMLRVDGMTIEVHLATSAGLPATPTRTDSFHEELRDHASGSDEYLHDLDGDGDVDVLSRKGGESSDDMESNRDFTFLVLINEGETLLPETPRQVFRFEGANVRPDVADVDGDGLPDLVFSKIVAPSLLDLTSPEGLELRRSVLVYLGQGDGRFSRRPDVEKEDVYGEASLGAAIVRRRLRTDFDGDGLADLVDIDLTGGTLIYRMRRESSFFGGETWELEESPWRRFDTRGAMRGTQVDDINGDGLGDLMSLRDDRLVLLLSRRTGARR